MSGSPWTRMGLERIEADKLMPDQAGKPQLQCYHCITFVMYTIQCRLTLTAEKCSVQRWLSNNDTKSFPLKAQGQGVHTLLAVVHLTPLSPRQGPLHFDYTQALTFTGSLMLILHDVIG